MGTREEVHNILVICFMVDHQLIPLLLYYSLQTSSAFPGPKFDWDYYNKCVVELVNVSLPMLR